METYVYWFLVSLILVGLEMMSGTFYLLIIGIAMAIGGTAALYGLSFPTQLTLAAVMGCVGIVVLWVWRSKHVSEASSYNFDIGQPVKILTMRDNGTARVFYRGAEWDAELGTIHNDGDGGYYIEEIKGSRLILTNRKLG